MPSPVKFRLFFAVSLVLLLGNVSPQTAAQPPTKNAPDQPAVAPASDEAEQSLSSIKIHEGWEISLYAAEPDVANVVAFDVDNRGRVFVCESFRQNQGVTDNRKHDETWLLADLAAETVQDRIDYHKRLLGDDAVAYTRQDDRIRRLEDTDRDGWADVSTIVAAGFNRIEEGTGAGVLVRGNTIYYTCIPKLWKLTDEDDDGKEEQRTPMSDGYGVRVAFRGHDLHGLIIGPDGRLYFSIGDRGYHVATDDGRLLSDPTSGAVFRCELDGSGLEVYATGMRNPQELAFNEIGDLFSVDNNSDAGDQARIIQILQGGDTGWRMHYQYLPDRGPFKRERIWEPFHNEQPAYIVPPIANFSDGPSGLAFYPGTGFGDLLKNRFLLSDFRGTPSQSGVRTFSIKSQGAFYALASDDQPIWSILATDVAFAPDGSLLISDWVTGWDGVGKGRLYRIVDPNYQRSPLATQVAELLSSDWRTFEALELQQHLGHPDQRIRLEAQWELARRSEADLLLSVATNTNASRLARLHAMWGADQVARQDSDQTESIASSMSALLGDPDAILRAAAAKIIGERQHQASIEQLRKLLADDSARVQYFAVLALSELNDDESVGAVTKILAKNDNKDPALRHAGSVFLAGVKDPKLLIALKDNQSTAVRRAAVVALRRKKHGQITSFLSDANPLVVAEAARAIHDVPIPAALPALAEMTNQPSEDIEMIRRALNANLRLGSAESAERVAVYAARESAPVEMRIEALDVLANWNSQDPRDRVLGMHLPRSERDAKLASDALETQIDGLMSSEATVRERSIQVAARLGIKKVAPYLAKRVTDKEVAAIDRANAMCGLSLLDAAEAVALAKKEKLRPSSELTLAAISVLADHDPIGSLEKIIAATESPNTLVRQLAWDALAKIEPPEADATIKSGVQAYLNGSLEPDVHLNVLEAAKDRLDAELQSELAEQRKSLLESNPLAPWLAAVEGGDVQKGRKLFFEKPQLSCVRCHTVGLSGGDVGPKLGKIAKEKDRRYLLESICLPDAAIAKGYETVVVATDSGQVHSGIVRKETDDFIDLIQPDGIQRRITIDQIVARRKGQSAMPADLVKQMTLRELRDLVAYLASLK